ncbi:hypothetical protein H5410_035657 [Solanum commersonii]|uniref:HECT-type E3 ubiquitin transferase n=1 Tax=Solanum commersonii TaxID=4109 RepID=A0A9J5Y1W9_SOLCO|nr:hypothetical protein H5410_035657 [Solanum commersonii]
MLYMSPDKSKKHVVDESIHRFINSLTSTILHVKRYSECARLILVFCKLLRRVVGLEDPLYRFCRSSIRDILEAVGIARCKKNVANELLAMNDAFMLVHEDVVVDLSPQSLVTLKELNNISKSFNNSEVFWQKLSQPKLSLCFLIGIYAKSFDDYQWIIEHKEVTNFKVQRHVTTRMLEEARGGNKEESYEMLIDKSELLEMFNLHKALEEASKVDPLHLEYFTFCGRMIVVALMHKVHIRVVIDRLFFLQLAGKKISLEDIRDADPTLYSSCKQILEMDPETVG